jgi:hypothetical protein
MEAHHYKNRGLKYAYRSHNWLRTQQQQMITSRRDRSATYTWKGTNSSQQLRVMYAFNKVSSYSFSAVAGLYYVAFLFVPLLVGCYMLLPAGE